MVSRNLFSIRFLTGETMQMTETRTFLMCDDDSPDFFVGRITRTQKEIIPELWNLPIGNYLNSTKRPNRSWLREK